MNDQAYQPTCQECDEDGVITLATQVVDAPWGRIDLCEQHYDQAGERGADRSTEDVGAGERMDAAYAAKARTR